MVASLPSDTSDLESENRSEIAESEKALKDGTEQPGIDCYYFESQQDKFQTYQRQRESCGHPKPLGIGVLMWDEVKVGHNIINPNKL